MALRKLRTGLKFAAGFCSRALAQACVSNGRGKRTNRALGRLVSRGYLTPEQAAPYFRKDNDDEFETFLNSSLSPGSEYVAHGIAEAAGGLESQWIRPQDTCENYCLAHDLSETRDIRGFKRTIPWKDPSDASSFFSIGSNPGGGQLVKVRTAQRIETRVCSYHAAQLHQQQAVN